MRCVLDTNVVASAMLWGGSPRLLLVAARDRRIQLFTSVPMLAELSDILGRPKFARKVVASGLAVEGLVDRYAGLAAGVRPIPVSGVAADPDDDIVIGTAWAAQAAMLVTGDKSLLAVGEFRGIRLVNVATALQALQIPQ